MGQEATLGKELMGYFVPGMGVGGIVFIIIIVWFHYRLKEIKFKSCNALEKATKSEKEVTKLSADMRVMTVEFKNLTDGVSRIEKNCRIESKLDKVLSSIK